MAFQIQLTAGCRQNVFAEFEPVSQFATGGARCHHMDESLLNVPP